MCDVIDNITDSVLQILLQTKEVKTWKVDTRCDVQNIVQNLIQCQGR